MIQRERFWRDILHLDWIMNLECSFDAALVLSFRFQFHPPYCSLFMNKYSWTSCSWTLFVHDLFRLVHENLFMKCSWTSCSCQTLLSTNWQMLTDTPVADIHSLLLIHYSLHILISHPYCRTLIYFTFILATSPFLLESE